jgi:hypothetical protein
VDDDSDEGKSEGYIGLMFLGAQDPNGNGVPRPISLRNYRFFYSGGLLRLGRRPQQ